MPYGTKLGAKLKIIEIKSYHIDVNVNVAGEELILLFISAIS